MFIKTIEYKNFNGEECKKEFRFNLTNLEIMELSDVIDMITNSKEDDLPNMAKGFKEIILKAYGVQSEDGERFVKSEELAIEFSQTKAFEVLFDELAGDVNKAIAFINGAAPQTLTATATPAAL